MEPPIQMRPSPTADQFFAPIGNTKPYFKAAIEGFAGSGKTYTAAKIAIGVHQRIQSKKPIVIFDTERASKFLEPLFAKHDIKVLVRESRSLADLKQTMALMSEGVSDVLLIDSLTHLWESVLAAYAEKKGRSRLEFQDWGIIKPMWRREFSDPFVADPYHAIFTGRAGYDYANEKNEETGKREVFKSGIKMKVEGDTAYEPDMLILMERFEEVLGDKKRVWREATIIKDRSTLIDGDTFQNPEYSHFAPAIEALLAKPMMRDAFQTEEADTKMLFKTDDSTMQWRRDKDKAMEEIEGLLGRIAPGTSGKDKTLKLELLAEVFDTTSMTAIGEMKLDDLRAGYRKLMDEAVTRDLAYYVDANGKPKFTVGADPLKAKDPIEALAAAVAEPVIDIGVDEGKAEPKPAKKVGKKKVATAV